MKSNYQPYLIGIILLGFGFLFLRPIPIPKEQDCLIIKGIVSGIYEGGTHDGIFKLKDQVKQYYVNRGTEYGLDIKKLQNELIDKEIVIKYPNYWLLTLPGNAMIHASIIEFNEKTIYTQLK